MTGTVMDPALNIIRDRVKGTISAHFINGTLVDLLPGQEVVLDGVDTVVLRADADEFPIGYVEVGCKAGEKATVMLHFNELFCLAAKGGSIAQNTFVRQDGTKLASGYHNVVAVTDGWATGLMLNTTASGALGVVGYFKTPIRIVPPGS